MYDQVKNVPQQTISKAKECLYPIPGKCMLDNMERNGLDCFSNLKSLEIFFDRLKSSSNPSLSKLKVIHQFNSPILNIYTYIFFICMQNIDSTVEIRENAIKFLGAIGEEEHFSITYILMTKKSSKKSVKVIFIIFYTKLVIFFR